MSKTWKREALERWDKRGQHLNKLSEEDEDADPRSYNVFQRNGQERDSRRLEKAFPRHA